MAAVETMQRARPASFVTPGRDVFSARSGAIVTAGENADWANKRLAHGALLSRCKRRISATQMKVSP